MIFTKTKLSVSTKSSLYPQLYSQDNNKGSPQMSQLNEFKEAGKCSRSKELSRSQQNCNQELPRALTKSQEL